MRAILLLLAALPLGAQAHFGHSALNQAVRIPDSVATPGVVRTTDARVVCKPGYAATQRHTAGSLKNKVYAEYGVTRGHPGPWEIDHVVSLELGGADVLGNLFPQPYFEVPGAHQKDKLENYLHAQVCAGAMDLEDAQALIRGDWYAQYVAVFGDQTVAKAP